MASLTEQAPPPTPTPSELAERVAGTHTATRCGDGHHARRLVLALDARLAALYERLIGSAQVAAAMGVAAEWCLDNQHVIQEALRQVEESLPRRFYAELPKLRGEEPASRARIYAVARVILEEAGGHVDLGQATRFLEAYQRVTPLTMGELWALPAMLRFALVEDLVAAGERLTGLASGEDPRDPTHVSLCVLGLRALAAEDWKAFFESVSRVEAILREDPAGVYSRMEFATRDTYRKAVERIAREGGRYEGPDEEAVARHALDLSRRRSREPRRGHVGFYLIGDGVTELRRPLGTRVGFGRALARAVGRRAVQLYLLLVAVLTAGLLWAESQFVAPRGTPPILVALILLSLVPASTVAVAIANWIVTHAVRPRLLPKLAPRELDEHLHRTLVVVPCVLTTAEEVREQLAELEVNFLGNPAPYLGYALLTDVVDAHQQHLSGDRALVDHARLGIEELNHRHGAARRAPFFLFHRDRRWNSAEGRWMGWERKRGKLEEFNRLLRGAHDTTFSLRIGKLEDLRDVRYVITVDADTFIPPGAAGRLVATLAHPLNAPELDPDGRVVAGYSVIQPRLETLASSAARTLFSRVFEADAGLDLYTHAVSDVYQDLAGEGSFAGKGIYDPAAFERSLAGRVPENALLSHDLFEGIQGRAGLASDVVFFESFPSHVLTYMRRLHRWVRGDWQLLPWLGRRVPAANGGRIANDLSTLDRWKILDNLRRSLLAPSLLGLLLAGWLALPGAPPVWSLFVVGVLAVPIFLQGASTVNQVVRASRARPLRPTLQRPGLWQGLRSLGADVWRWFLGIAFLPYEAVVTTDAVLRTLGRVFLTRRGLLEWTTAAHAARALGKETSARLVWRDMFAAPVVALLALALGALLRPSALPAILPPAFLWLVSPWVAHRISLPRAVPRPSEAEVVEREELRLLARRTWLFFQHFIGPENRWLPPDNFQEDPGGIVARRTSPTNVGMALLSVLAAYDLGFVGALTLVATLRNAFDSLDRLERHRGHFLNWYDTSSLAPLRPRYVSTVDSGNLAASLLILSRGCTELRQAPVLRQMQARGFLDTLTLLRRATGRLESAEVDQVSGALSDRMAALRRRVIEAAETPERLQATLGQLLASDLPDLEELVVALAETGSADLDTEALRDLRIWAAAAGQDLLLWKREAEALAPWLAPLRSPPGLYADSRLDAQRAWRALVAALPRKPTLGDVPRACRRGLKRLAQLEAALTAVAPSQALEEARAWNGRLHDALESALGTAQGLLADLRELSERAERMAEEMDFEFLYDRRRNLFYIGYDATAGRPDPNHYDLLASESRLASFVAIAKGDVPTEHWLHLGRPFTGIDGTRALLSWGGTMFEYLMPPLFMRSPEYAVLGVSCRAAVGRQVAYGRAQGRPWGISESGFHELDPRGNYQYRAFGVPSLGLKRDLGRRLVVAPYASVMALALEPRAVESNLEELREMGLLGRYGLFEAVDFGRPSANERGRIVRSYMAHHQGMILVGLDHYLRNRPMVRRFHAHPRIATVDYLLHEQVPWQAPLRVPLTSDGDRRTGFERRAMIETWAARTRAYPPQLHVLSNGRLSVWITASGAGGSFWKGRALTRWRPDPTAERLGEWLYVQDLDSGALWSCAREPTLRGVGRGEAIFAPHAVELYRRNQGIAARTIVVVPPDDDLAIRRVRLVNESGRSRRMALASYAEVALAPPADDRRHPAFNKLFIESEFLPERSALLFRRRPRSADEPRIYLLHAVVGGEGARPRISCETDRLAFLGRLGSARRPQALAPGRGALSGTTGATLDPVLSLRCEVELSSRAEVEIAFLTIAGASRAEVLARLDAYRSLAQVEWALQQARDRSETELHDLAIPPGQVRVFQALLSALLHPSHVLRAPSGGEGGPAVEPARRELWKHGISGDYPILLARIDRAEDVAVVRELLQAHAYWRRRRVEFDLVILDDEPVGYARPLRNRLERVIVESEGAAWRDQRAGIFLLGTEAVGVSDRAALEAAAAVWVDAAQGSLAGQLERLRALPPELPGFVPMPSAPFRGETTAPLERRRDLLFDNGLGGFSADGKEYVIHLEGEARTPAPWINVIANPSFGFLISESGGGCTWSEHSAENRLTPWRNDPVADLPGETLYLRDEETAEVWSATPRPAGRGQAYRVRHGAGYTVFEHNRHGLEHVLRVFAAPDAPVKIVELELRNVWGRPRRLTATYYAEWVLGESRELTLPTLRVDYDHDAGALLARNPFLESFGSRVAFLVSNLVPHGLTMDRREFLGRNGDPARPAALGRVGLSGAMGANVDPCAALQVHLDLAAGETRTVSFALGQGTDREDAVRLARRFREPGEIEVAWRGVGETWDRILGAVQVATPDRGMDLVLNRWLLYQTVACRLWGRSALYQSSGAFGFRDQLQDVLALLHGAPEWARTHILRCAGHQFEEGDVLHWWHPPAGEGVRTRCSDDLLWLPYVTAAYVRASGDDSILEESAPFLAAEPLGPEEEDRYRRFDPGPTRGTLYEHCLRALDKGTTAGPHGLPLIGAHDWNDGLNRVGVHGKGESVWLGWFLHAALLDFAPLCERRGEGWRAAELRRRAERVRAAVEEHGWDGRWYRRAYYDDGSPLGAASNREAQIDNLSQSWAVLSGGLDGHDEASPDGPPAKPAGSEEARRGGDPGRSRRALESVMERLVRGDPGLVCLFWPPFERTQRDPGYIKGYPPGVRENGGQYSHAAAWVGWAFAQLGDGGRAHSIFHLLNPVVRSETPGEIDLYRVEPYVTVADIYSAGRHVGQGGWTWYTGSAAWTYRLGMEAILGLRMEGGSLRIDPCIPPSWPGFEAVVRRGSATCHIRVENPARVSRGVVAVTLDGKSIAAAAGVGAGEPASTSTNPGVFPHGASIGLTDDGATHEVLVRLG